MIKPRFVIYDYDSRCVMHCRTREDAKSFLQHLHELGKTWCSGQSYANVTNYDQYGGDTCYSFADDTYCDIGYFIEEGYTILEYDDFDWGDGSKVPDMIISFDDMFCGLKE